MQKYKSIFIFLIVFAFLGTGCNNKMRKLTISPDNSIVYSSFPDIVKRMDADETFIVYFGYAKCPWCRGNLEAMLESAEDNNLEVIYYVDVYESRDLYEIKNNKNQSIITENGANLSGGQKQMVSLARALMKHGDILILDEASSAIDTQTEKIFQDAIRTVYPRTTTIVISHHQKGIQLCNRIVIMNKGRIVAIGTHDELIKSNTQYQKFMGYPSL